MIALVFFAHAYWFFFDPGAGHQWYEGNVYGNLVAIVPTGLILFFYIRSRHIAVMESHKALAKAHNEHAEKLAQVLDKLDPATDGGIADVHLALAVLKDDLDPATPGGIGVLAADLAKLAPHHD
jgi:hypothetical protein